MFAQMRVWMLAGLMAWALSHATVFGGQEEAKEMTPAEKIRKALDQTMALDFQGGTLADVIQHLKEKTKINFLMDAIVLQGMGIGPDGNPLTMNLTAGKNTRLRTALQALLHSQNLTYVILEDSVLITSEDMGLHRQMRQRVTVDFKDKPLSAALKDLSRATGLNLVLDPKAKTEEKVTLQLDDAALDTTVRLLAEMGGLKSVRMGNVLFITDEKKADKIRKEEAPMLQPPTTYAVPPVAEFRNGAFGGFGGGVFGGGGNAVPFQPVPPEKFKQLQRGIFEGVPAVPGIAPPPGIDAAPAAPAERIAPPIAPPQEKR